MPSLATSGFGRRTGVYIGHGIREQQIGEKQVLKDVLLVALGGGIGSATRYLVGLSVLERWPGAAWAGTLTVNLVGCFLMGFLFAMARRHAVSTSTLYPMITTGALGGFTTFSTFSLDAMRAVETGRPGLAASYVAVSVVGGLVGCAAGLAAGRAGA